MSAARELLGIGIGLGIDYNHLACAIAATCRDKLGNETFRLHTRRDAAVAPDLVSEGRAFESLPATGDR